MSNFVEEFEELVRTQPQRQVSELQEWIEVEIMRFAANLVRYGETEVAIAVNSTEVENGQ